MFLFAAAELRERHECSLVTWRSGTEFDPRPIFRANLLAPAPPGPTSRLVESHAGWTWRWTRSVRTVNESIRLQLEIRNNLKIVNYVPHRSRSGCGGREGGWRDASPTGACKYSRPYWLSHIFGTFMCKIASKTDSPVCK